MEIWKEIELNRNYEVSNSGLIRNKKTNKILKQQSNQQNQLTVLLSDNGLDKRILVSRLVGISFVKNLKPNKYNVVMHRDDNPANNHTSNLMWGTQKMNMHDMINKGRSKRIITDEQILFIRNNHYRLINQYDKKPIGKYSTMELANMFNVSKSAILPIIQNKRYKI
jgi:hypothetical protein